MQVGQVCTYKNFGDGKIVWLPKDRNVIGIVYEDLPEGDKLVTHIAVFKLKDNGYLGEKLYEL
jgi:hypothetical protein